MIRKETIVGPCRLLLGDCMEILPTLGRFDAVVTDPPYGLNLGLNNDQRQDSSHLGKRSYSVYEDTYENFVNLIVPRLNAAIGKAERAVVFTGPHIHEQFKPNAIGGIYHPSAVGRTSWGFKQFLPVLFYGTAPRLQNGSRPTVIRSTAISEKYDHPCVKPLEWMEWLVDTSSNAGDHILDPFMGSGTTGVACIKTGRQFTGIEIDEKYYAIAVRRCKEAWGDGSLFDDKAVAESKTLFAGAESC